MADVIVIPGRGIAGNGTLPPDPLSRVRKGVELYKKKAAPVIIMSGSWSYRSPMIPARTEAAAMKEYALSLGAPSNRVLEETQSKDTLGNAYFTKKIFCEPEGWQDIIVVVSQDHLERSRYIFSKVFGPGYAIHYEVSEKVISDKQYALELKHETTSLNALKSVLDEIREGDDASMWRLMSKKHPAYRSNKT